MVKIRDGQIEGRNSVLEALYAGRPIDKIFVKKGQHRGSIIDIINKAKELKIPVVEVDEAAFCQWLKLQGIREFWQK